MRTVKKINDGWTFTKEGKSTCVDLPHTWNGEDGQDGGNDYYRGICVYEKTLACGDFPPGDEIWVQFDGVNSCADVYFNGIRVATHEGGYSAFRARLENIREENILRVEADNREKDNVYPKQADFTFYGGIYRDVSLIGVSRTHFDLGHFGSPGISVTAEREENGYVAVIRAYCRGRVRFEVLDGETAVGAAEADGENPACRIGIPGAHLWDGRKDPYLYTARAILYDGEEPADMVSLRFGCREMRVDAQKGFLLNGREYPLRGVARHQDRPKIGNALTEAHHREDVGLILEMGANSVRLAHYQHAQCFYDLCDEYGLIVWAEIPYISRHMEEGNANTEQQLTELICQTAHHACIAVWSLSNEITMGDMAPGTEENHRRLREIARRLDPSRPAAVAAFTTCPTDAPYLRTVELVAYNHYFGWYGGTLADYGAWLDGYHKKYPQTPIGMSEYGCEALNWHSSSPEQGDYTEEYQAIYHEELIKQIAERPYLWCTYVWNMFDFAADGRNEGGENGMNHKGLVSFDRTYKKDSFYAYQAWLSDVPMVHLCGKRYVDRVEEEAEVRVYSNCDEVELFANDIFVEKQKRGKYPFFVFRVRNEGETRLSARSGELRDDGLIRRAEKFNEAYRFKEEGAVLNWFELSAPDGYFSVNDTLGEVYATFRGKLLLLRMLLLMKKKKSAAEKKGERSPSGHEVSKTTLKLAMGFTVKRGVGMMGNMFSKEEILDMNARLNRIRKPKKRS